jgi:hypothetical protein
MSKLQRIIVLLWAVALAAIAMSVVAAGLLLRHAERPWPMTQPNKREQLAAMRLEEFKDHLRAMAGGSS